MPRKLRVDHEDVWHHVMNRGVDHEVVFHQAGDARLFLGLVGEAIEHCGVEVHSYCLMPNHYHLLVHCPEGGLSAFMQRVGARYTQAINQRLERDGPIFRGRFHSRLIDTPEYRRAAGRYIHRNPLELASSTPLDRYRWSSYGAYVGAAVAPEWLQTGVLLSMHRDAATYRAFVETEVSGADSLRMAIHRAVLEVGDVPAASLERVERLVALALLADRPADPTLRALVGDLADGARRVALSRIRKRVHDEPWLAQAARVAQRLAA